MKTAQERATNGTYAGRDIRNEANALARMLVKDPNNGKLRERAEMAQAAMRSEVTRRVYLKEYPSADLPRQARADYSNKKSPPAGRTPTNEEIVRAWQTSDSRDEAAEKLGVNPGWLGVKVGALKRIGVRVKRLNPRPPDKTDVDALNALIDGLG